MRSAADILDAFHETPLKTDTGVGDALGVSSKRIWMWRDRNSIAAAFWLPLAELAEKHGAKGVSLETIARVHAKAATPSEAA